ncbi:enoyl-CoA hydratase/isomerase family protein [Mangrovicoccus algicola]|uniref:3-hydroxyisobutyryl-CoA hydrolase n=1 Tax=Mangrovicoccus algicola TaxID=2771008 RepID=A0A8J6Z1U7_9RHOB|nr:enoyl-CoA hydratase/isomerase family protein [Mangrovicoccus algicola]MBE3640056.1 enoyl-CoA hydratase/isomerase family protein [Mangrovicoccus algicola]
MAEIRRQVEGAAGRITLARPQKLNALSHAMCLEMEAALDAWSHDDDVALVVIDAEGDRAFCAGGDLRAIHDHLGGGDPGAVRQFWRDEYRLNLKIAEYPKPVVALIQGYCMGGGVGIGAHASHRVVCESSCLAMPECAIGLVPDVGGSWLLAQAPGHLGEFLALTAGRVGPGAAIAAGLADYYLPQERWRDLMRKLSRGTVSAVADLAEPPPEASPPSQAPWIDAAFSRRDPGAILAALDEMSGEAGEAPSRAAAAIRQNAPLSMAAALTMIRGQRGGGGGLASALAQEYRFGCRALERPDLPEGLRARMARDGTPARWGHGAPTDVAPAEVAAMLASLGEDELRLGKVY